MMAHLVLVALVLGLFLAGTGVVDGSIYLARRSAAMRKASVQTGRHVILPPRAPRFSLARRAQW